MSRSSRLHVAIPPLEPGDRLTREEFERRYYAMPNLKKAELIEGVVYMPSPVRLDRHGAPHAELVAWLVVYKSVTPGVRCADNTTVRLDETNEPQPDALLMIDPARGGQARISTADYVETAPELVAEVAASSASYDLHTKLGAYLRNGVREYIVWVRHEVAGVTVMNFVELHYLRCCSQYPTGTCVRDNPGVRSSRHNVASSRVEGDRGREAKAATPSIQGVGNQDRAVRSTDVKCC